MNKGLLLVISAPSGAGKSTLCRALMERRERMRLSISCTTRPPRSGEINGKDYHFLAPLEFEKQVAAGAFIEWARVHDYCYGTLKAPVEEALAQGADVLLNIDTQGAKSVKALFPECVRAFICPPSWKTLEERLRGRGQDNEAVIATRLANAKGEIAHLPEYDYAVVNDRLEDAVEDLLAILRAEKRCLTRAAGELKSLGFL
jgi:guanylate kinase